MYSDDIIWNTSLVFAIDTKKNPIASERPIPLTIPQTNDPQFIDAQSKIQDSNVPNEP
jgi:hypothetical protein